MTENLQDIRDRIVTAMLPQAAQEGWTWSAAKAASLKAGFQDRMTEAVFPEGLNDLVAHFADMVDRKMLEKLRSVRVDDLRVRERIETAILFRFEALETMGSKDLLKRTLSYWAVPVRTLHGQRVLWRTSDRIWNWAGDTAQDYNRYTKRGLLSSILIATSLVWADDQSPGRQTTKASLKRRIENVLEIGKTMGKLKALLPGSSSLFSFRQ